MQYTRGFQYVGREVKFWKVKVDVQVSKYLSKNFSHIPDSKASN